MMGFKEQAFAPLPPVSLEDMVPPHHCSRHLERTLDLAFVRDLVEGTYAETGRPSIDPVVFFKLQLILFFEGARSERQLLRVVADRLSLRWYLGYTIAMRSLMNLLLSRPSQPTRCCVAHSLWTRCPQGVCHRAPGPRARICVTVTWIACAVDRDPGLSPASA